MIQEGNAIVKRNLCIGGNMQEILYFYSNGTIQENPENLPQSVLAKLSGDEHSPVFRFAFIQAQNKVHVQDQSFRALLGEGDQGAWKLANEALAFLESKFQARFLERAYGDVPGSSNRRMFSQYRKAWAMVARYLHAEFGISPMDVHVCEYCPLPGHEAERVTLSPKGGPCAGGTVNGPLLYVNRYMGRDNGSADFSMVNREVADFYLQNVVAIMALAGGNFEPKAKRNLDALGYELMFAIKDKQGRTRVARARQRDRNRLYDEAALRDSEGLKGYSGPLLLFHYEARDGRIVVVNGMPAESGNDVMGMLRDVVKKVSQATHEPEESLSVTFESGMSSPFASKLSRYPVLWEVLAPAKDVQVVEMPVPIEGGIAATIKSPDEEEAIAPSSQRLRAVNGLAVDYPFILVDGRSTRLGMKLRAMLGAYAGLSGMAVKEPSLEDMRDMGVRASLAKRVSFMLSMGLDRRDVVDFFAEPMDFPRRAEMWAIASEVAESRAKDAHGARVSRRAAMKLASMGPGLGINDWWYIGLQESLNEAQHEGDKPKTEPFNLKKRLRSKEPMPFEAMLRGKHDDQGSSQKPLNQLLDESRT